MKKVKMSMSLRVCAYPLLLLLALPVAGASSDAAPPSLEGTWVVRVLFGGAFKIQYLQTFTHDGKTTIFLPFGGPVNSDDTRVACTGEWRRAGKADYDVTMYCLGTQEWETAPDRIRARLTLGEGARTFTDSPFKYEVFLVDGTPVFSGDGLMTGHRLEIVPLD